MALKQYKPTSPGQRGLVLVDKSSLSKDRPIKNLLKVYPQNLVETIMEELHQEDVVADIKDYIEKLILKEIKLIQSEL